MSAPDPATAPRVSVLVPTLNSARTPDDFALAILHSAKSWGASSENRSWRRFAP